MGGRASDKQKQPIYADAIDEVIRTHSNALHQSYRDIMSNHEDPETIHKFRVSIRRLRSVVSLLKFLFDDPEYRFFQQNLKQYLLMVAEIREIDVYLEYWRTCVEQQIQKNDTRSLFSDTLRHWYTVSIERLLDSLEHTHQQQNLNHILSQIQYAIRAGLQDEKKLDKKIQKCFENWKQRILDGIKECDFNDLENVHALRVQIKKYRYATDAFSVLLNQSDLIDPTTLKQLQSLLGVICDEGFLKDFLMRFRHIHEDEEYGHEVDILRSYMIQRSDEAKYELCKQFDWKKK